MKEEKKENIEKIITIEDIQKINPNTISKIILLDGTVLTVQNEPLVTNEENSKKSDGNNDIGATTNLKLSQIPNSNKKPKNRFSYIEWDFPNTKNKNHSFQRNIENELRESKTEQNEENNKKDNSRDSVLNRSRKSKNYSFYESKHISKKKEKKENNESKNTSGIISKNEENYNFKEINNSKDNNNSQKEKEKEKEDNNNKNNIIKNNNRENKEEISKTNNNEKKDEIKNNKINKDNLTFHEKIKLIKYGLLDYESDFNATGLKNDENNIQKINKIRPLNIIIDKSKNKNKNDEDINKQFNKLLNKFNENKNTNKKISDDNSYLTYKAHGRENNLNDDINRLNNFIHKNKFSYTYKNENNKGNSYRDLNERISQLRKKTLNNSLVSFLPSKNVNGQRTKLLVLPSNFK